MVNQPFRRPRRARDWFRREMESLLRDMAGDPSRGRRRARSGERRSANVFPPVNIYDDGERFRLRAEMPGVSEDSLEIDARRAELTIRGVRNESAASRDAQWHRRERQTGEFRRTITLPEEIDTSKVRAKLRQGVLDVVAPRRQETDKKKIEIQ